MFHVWKGQDPVHALLNYIVKVGILVGSYGRLSCYNWDNTECRAWLQYGSYPRRRPGMH